VREGGICYLDEIVEARKDTTVVLHPLTDHRRVLPIDKTGELLEAHPDFMLVISYNPGYQNVMKGLKPSTRQRFVAMTFDYPQADIEQEIVVRETEVDPAVATQLVALAHAMRRLTDFELEEAASTRLLIYAGLLINSGLPVKEACVHAMIEPLTDDNETQQALLKLVDLHFE
jgi:nitric oxide reductase NorQ protein